MTDGALTGKAALVTGGSGGIGSACARFLARDGAAVTLMARDADRLHAVAAEIRSALDGGGRVDVIAGDATDRDDVQAAVEKARATTGVVDICVATVGGGVIAPLLLLDDTDLVDQLRRNIVSAFLAIKYTVPAMVPAGGGSIVCISSDSATMSWPFLAGYCAAKAGLDAMVRVAADELGRHNIRVNAVRPGLTRTPSNNISMIFSDPEIIEEFISQKPLARTGTPDDVAAGVRFLAGPESSWITGQSLAIEGGNELRRAPSLEKVARHRYGDDAVDAALSGRLPD